MYVSFFQFLCEAPVPRRFKVAAEDGAENIVTSSFRGAVFPPDVDHWEVLEATLG